MLIMVGYALDGLVKQGEVIADSRTALARSGIGVVVKAGAPKPDISTVDALRQALLDARSVAYSDSASGVYIQNEMFKQLGIEEQVKGKARMIPAEPVGAGGRARGGRDRLPADQRAEADPWHRRWSGRCRQICRNIRCSRRGLLRGEGAGCGASVDPVSCFTPSCAGGR